jgi:hypothetical protein
MKRFSRSMQHSIAAPAGKVLCAFTVWNYIVKCVAPSMSFLESFSYLCTTNGG